MLNAVVTDAACLCGRWKSDKTQMVPRPWVVFINQTGHQMSAAPHNQAKSIFLLCSKCLKCCRGSWKQPCKHHLLLPCLAIGMVSASIQVTKLPGDSFKELIFQLYKVLHDCCGYYFKNSSIELCSPTCCFSTVLVHGNCQVKESVFMCAAPLSSISLTVIGSFHCANNYFWFLRQQRSLERYLGYVSCNNLSLTVLSLMAAASLSPSFI